MYEKKSKQANYSLFKCSNWFSVCSLRSFRLCHSPPSSVTKRTADNKWRL